MTNFSFRVAQRFILARNMTRDQALQIFGFPSGSEPSPEEVNKTYKQLALQNHPDRGGDLDKMVDVNVAKDILSGSREPTYNSIPSGAQNDPTPRYKPQPDPPEDKVTFHEALAGAGLPADVRWMFVTDRGHSGYSSDEFHRSNTGYVAVGEHGNQWVFLAAENNYYRSYVPGGYFSLNKEMRPTDKWVLSVLKLPKTGDVPGVSELYGGVVRAWKLFQGVDKKWNSKIAVLPEDWKPSEKTPPAKTTIKKYLMDLGAVTEDPEAGRVRKYRITLMVQQEYGASGYDYKLDIDGREFAFSKADSEKMDRIRLAYKVMGPYIYSNAKKELNRAKMGKAVMEWMLKNSTMPDWVTKALESTLALMAAPAKKYAYSR